MDLEVEAFYRKDYISRIKPSRKDVIKVKKDNGDVEVMAKRYMLLTVAEAHTIYLKENDGNANVVKKSQFYHLRTEDVFLISKSDQEVCVCPTCENVGFYCETASLTQTLLPIRIFKDVHVCKSGKCALCPINNPDFSANHIPECDAFHLKRWVKGLLVVDIVEEDMFQNFNNNSKSILSTCISKGCKVKHWRTTRRI